MNSSTLRRLASDHAALHKTDLPPYYLFPPSAASSGIPDDLTQLTILLTGPQGTPYCNGLWKLLLKIPLDYPKSPPKASFKTKIWHPNVEESTGSVCLDTLKRDWQPKLTLRDILITISCLLINPNPDSALNAAAGQLLQEDYEAFSRQAMLMTSIHATVSPLLQKAAEEARSRGEEPEEEMSPPEMPKGSATEEDEDDYDDENNASKENDPSLSPSPVAPVVNVRRSLLGKRPLSDLPTPIDTDEEDHENITCSERNIAANTPNLSNNMAHMGMSTGPQRRSPKLVERSRGFNFANRSKDECVEAPLITPYVDVEDQEQPTAKRVCSGEGKENANQAVDMKLAGQSKSAPLIGLGVKTTATADVKKTYATNTSSSTSSKSIKPRIGLRRL